MILNAIEFQNVNKRFKDATTNVLSNINLKIKDGEFITILGSSGCGKTTMMKMINRLVEPDSGEIMLFGKNIKQEEPVTLRKSIGYVIQQIGLFPHMTIYNNIAVLPKLLKWSAKEIDFTVEFLLTLVGLEPKQYKFRFPAQLSGGQQQRVGVARALAGDPQVILFDEPFGAIDAITRDMLQNEIIAIHQKLKKTFVFVTHDINEALKLGDRIVIMNAGEILQFATPAEIVRNPRHAFVKQLIDSAIAQQKVLEKYI